MKNPEYDYIDKSLRKLLIDKTEPKEGLTVEELTKIVYPNWEEMRPDMFRCKAQLITDRLAMVMKNECLRIKEDIANKVEPILAPVYFPSHLKIKKDNLYWIYYNAAVRLGEMAVIVLRESVLSP